jgi:phosphate transport system substrate-binding protein
MSRSLASRGRLALAASLVSSLSFLAASAHAESIKGAGSSAAAPVYRTWAAEYARSGGPALDYAPVGSSAGMSQIVQRQVDFGASDVIAPGADLRKNDLVMFPTVITGVVPVANVPHKGGLRLTGDVLARIFLGEITSWDAPEIVALNPQAKLPALPIKVVARADGSGTTYHFSDYLGRASATWRQKRGVASRFEWPAGVVAVKGSAAVSQAVRETTGAIGYIDYNYVVDDHLTGVAMKNADGVFVEAGVEAFREAVTHSAWYATGDFGTELNDLPGAGTWPITMGTYVALPRVAKGEGAERALRFVMWSYLHGDALARQARFVPLPEKVQASAYRQISSVKGEQGESIGIRLMAEFVH